MAVGLAGAVENTLMAVEAVQEVEFKVLQLIAVQPYQLIGVGGPHAPRAGRGAGQHDAALVDGKGVAHARAVLIAYIDAGAHGLVGIAAGVECLPCFGIHAPGEDAGIALVLLTAGHRLLQLRGRDMYRGVLGGQADGEVDERPFHILYLDPAVGRAGGNTDHIGLVKGIHLPFFPDLDGDLGPQVQDVVVLMEQNASTSL